MEKPIMRDVMFLSRKSEEATEQDRQVIQDLKDMLAAHRQSCVGMAANMIGVKKRIIIVALGFADMIMINPVITAKSEPYDTEEGCLSLDGVRKTKRYGRITVRYQDESFRSQSQEFKGQIAQIIQHECDHLEGIII